MKIPMLQLVIIAKVPPINENFATKKETFLFANEVRKKEDLLNYNNARKLTNIIKKTINDVYLKTIIQFFKILLSHVPKR